MKYKIETHVDIREYGVHDEGYQGVVAYRISPEYHISKKGCTHFLRVSHSMTMCSIATGASPTPFNLYTCSLPSKALVNTSFP